MTPLRTAAQLRVDTPGRPPLFLVRDRDLEQIVERGERVGSSVWTLAKSPDGTEEWVFWRTI